MARAKVDGLRELEDVFGQLANPAARRASGRRALKKVGEPLAEDMRRRAPRRRGFLANSIAVSAKLSKRQGRLHRKVSDRKTGVEVFVGPSYGMTDGGRHAHLAEFGSGPRYQKNGRYVGEMPPQPFARPAWDAQRDSLVEKVGHELWTDIRKTVARAEARARRLAARG